MSKRSELSFDILQLLVEFSASSNIGTACVLSRVSQQLQLWSDVHLFRFLVEWENLIDEAKSMGGLLAKMCSDNASPRLIRARQHVRSLSWFQVLPTGTPRHLRRYIFLLPNLIQLCAWGNYLPEFGNADFGFNFEESHPSLRKVFTCSYTLKSLPKAKFDYPFWKTITHLQLAPNYSLCSDNSPFAQPLLTNLKHLTHLAIGSPRIRTVFIPQPVFSLDTLISRVQSAFPPSLQLCLISFEAELITTDTKSLVTSLQMGKVDKRIVLWSMPFVDGEYVVRSESRGTDAFQVWCGIPDEQETFWEAGESIQRMRN
ncbi:hypothetical protein DL96DRAFT_1617020 [Flagelloscypha sp. PMI_526]|nr:hypothetical protein DL96DRAFT_1617020 [Flagelloscypha sp. PMI_526]